MERCGDEGGAGGWRDPPDGGFVAECNETGLGTDALDMLADFKQDIWKGVGKC